jgi:hypothetical protein
MADSRLELLDLVKRALADAQRSEFPLSRLIEQAIRVASQRNDDEIVASLRLETIDYDDKRAGSEILQRLRAQLPPK